MNPAPAPKMTQLPSAQFVGFELDGQKCLFHIESIQEIVTPGRVTRLPDVPAYVVGVSNLRGTIIPIIDLRMLFGLEQRMADADTRTIVINVGSRIMGCTVDSVSQVIRLQADQIRPAPEAVVSDKQRFVEGFARSGDDLFIVLDANCLLDPAGLASVSKSGVPSISDTDAPNAGDLT